MNRYPLWKYAIIVVALLIAVLVGMATLGRGAGMGMKEMGKSLEASLPPIAGILPGAVDPGDQPTPPQRGTLRAVHDVHRRGPGDRDGGGAGVGGAAAGRAGGSSLCVARG